MPKQQLNIKKLLEANPSVNAEKLMEVLKALRELRKSGVIKTSDYDLAIPFSKRVVQSDESRSASRPTRRR